MLTIIRLQDDLKSDRWITNRPRKLMAGPKRVPFKNLRTMQHEYHLAFMQWFIGGALLTWPIACMMGYRMQRY